MTGQAVRRTGSAGRWGAKVSLYLSIPFLLAGSLSTPSGEAHGAVFQQEHSTFFQQAVGASAPAAQPASGSLANTPGVTSIAPMAVPFGPGERAEYQVKLGIISAGSAVMEIPNVEPLRGVPSYHVSWRVEGRVLFARVNDRYQSWMDVTTLASRRFLQNLHQVNYRSERHYEIFPEAKRWERLQTDERGTFTADAPLDDVAFIYYVRTIPLEVGQTYTLHRYFRQDRNPVTLRVLRKETIQVPAGTFNTIVVQPIIVNAGGLFGEGGNAEVYFTDDDRRLLVRLNTKGIPLLGDLSFHLRSYQAGTPLTR